MRNMKERLLELAHPFADLVGLVVEDMAEGSSSCTLEVNEKLYNPQNVLHGAVIYALADTGMGAALYPLLKDGEFCATVEIKITYFKAVRSGSLECTSKVINNGKTIASLESEILNDGKLIAKAYGTFSVFTP